MLKITKPADNRVDIELAGEIDSEIMRKALDDLVEKSENVTDGIMLYTITEFSMPTLGAFGVEFSRLPKLFGLLGKYKKCAVLSDDFWLRKTAEIEGALFPGIEIKAFEQKEKKAAEKWLAA